MPFLFLLFPIIEFFVFIRFVQAFSFLDALLTVFIAGALGLMIMKLQGKATFSLLSKDLAAGQVPSNQILHRGFVIMGGLLLFIPGFVSDLMGILCILPGTRHLMVLYFKLMIKKGLFRGKVFMSGFGMPKDFQFRRPPPHSPGPDWHSPRTERDAQVVDIEPIEITHTNKNSDS